MVTEIRIKSYRLFFLSSKNLAALCRPVRNRSGFLSTCLKVRQGDRHGKALSSMQSKRGSACFLIREPPNA